MERVKLRILMLGLIFYFAWLPVLTRNEEKERVNKEKERTEEAGQLTVFCVKIAVDQIITARLDWPDKVKNLIDSINKEFQKQGARIKFDVVETTTWEVSPETKSLLSALDEFIKKVPRNDYDLIIGLTDQNYDDLEKGCGYYSNPGYILVKEANHQFYYVENLTYFHLEKTWTVILVMHEIGHFFGLPHSKNPESIMHDKHDSRFRQDLFLKEEIGRINAVASAVKKEKRGVFGE